MSDEFNPNMTIGQAVKNMQEKYGYLDTVELFRHDICHLIASGLTVINSNDAKSFKPNDLVGFKSEILSEMYESILIGELGAKDSIKGTVIFNNIDLESYIEKYKNQDIDRLSGTLFPNDPERDARRIYEIKTNSYLQLTESEIDFHTKAAIKLKADFKERTGREFSDVSDQELSEMPLSVLECRNICVSDKTHQQANSFIERAEKSKSQPSKTQR